MEIDVEDDDVLEIPKEKIKEALNSSKNRKPLGPDKILVERRQ